MKSAKDQPESSKLAMQAMLEEYRMLWSEMNNRSSQQQTLITTAWILVLGSGTVGLFSTQEKKIEDKILVGWLLLLTIALSVLCFVFVRYDQKILRILEYMYTRLRPKVRKVIDSLANPALVTPIWQWPSEEWDIVSRPPLKLYYIGILEGCRYLVMIIPSLFVIALLWHFRIKVHDTGLWWLFLLSTLIFLCSVIASLITFHQFSVLLKEKTKEGLVSSWNQGEHRSNKRLHRRR